MLHLLGLKTLHLRYYQLGHSFRIHRELFSSGSLVKTEKYKVYRLRSPCPEEIPESGFVNRLIIRLRQSFRRLKRTQEKLTMPPKPPESIRGMKCLNKDAFLSTIQVPSLEVPSRHVVAFQKVVKKYMLKQRGIRPVAEPAEDDLQKDEYRLFLFDPERFYSVDELKKTFGEDVDLCKFGVDLSSWKVLNIDLSYTNWHYDEILKAILPEESDGVGGFSTIGHIVHLNLKEELYNYKKIIGEVLLDKIPSAKTVVNKTGTIDNTYRNFAMEVLAGKDDFITVAKENGERFEMDFSKVYWNPRLGTEHNRIVSQLKSGDVIYDVFAGIGPFSVPAAKRGCVVFANDLNPESFKWLKVNVKQKKGKPAPLLFNLDGRQFIKTVVMEDLKRRWKEAVPEEDNKYKIHVVMNLPALAIEFLDAFQGILSEFDQSSVKSAPVPIVHCYAFSKADDPVADVKERVEAVISCPLPEGYCIRMVRNVAPNKEMLCAEFQLQKHCLLVRGKTDENDYLCSEPPEKKCKTVEETPSN